MYILKNAFTSIQRSIGRNLLMGVIIIVIACATTVTLAIRNSANTLIESYESGEEILANIGVNREQMMGMFKPGEEGKRQTPNININSLTNEDYLNYADSIYVKDFYYTYSLGINANNLNKVEVNFANDENFSKNGRGPSFSINTENQADFTLMGYSKAQAMNDFMEGRYKITDGEISEDFTTMTCVINEELATTNDLEVGDTITIINPDNSKITYDLTITGIFSEEINTEDSRMSFISMSANMIITNSTVVETINEDSDTEAVMNPTYILTSSKDVDNFTKEVEAKGIDEMYQISTNLESLENETLSIRNVATYVMTFLIITLIIGGVVLFILNLINVRERKYEIGVLRTIGMKKSKVSLQFICELLMITLIALFVGFGIGSAMSVPIANKMLDSEIKTQEEKRNEANNNFGGGNIFTNQSGFVGRGVVANNIDYISEINAVVDIKVLFQLLGIGFLLTLISSTAAMSNIAKFRPLTILKERS